MTSRKIARLLLAPGLALALAGCVMGPAGHGSFERTLAVNGPVAMEVESGSGEVIISRGAAGSVRVRGEFEVYGRLDESPSEKIAALQQDPPVVQQGNSIRLTRPRDVFGAVRINYTITVPEETSVRASSGSGRIEVSGLRGPVRLESASGGLRLLDVSGDAETRSSSGSQQLTNIGGSARTRANSGSLTLENVRGEVRVEAGSGRVTIAHPGARVYAETRSGEIRVDDAPSDVHAEAGSGSINVSGSPKERFLWEIETRSGSVTLDLGMRSSYRLEARTSSGRFRLEPELRIQEQTRRLLRATAGDGIGRISVQTGSGTIRLR